MRGPVRTILAIEAAVAGGSIAIISGGEEIAAWVGSASQSKAEELIPTISSLLERNAMSLHDIDLIAVSAGPGSFTGIRIGIATALGLKIGLDTQMASESVLKCIAAAHQNREGVTVAVPMGRNAICQQRFEFREHGVIAVNEPETVSDVSFLRLTQHDESTFVVHSDIFEQMETRVNLIDAGRNLAALVGRFCIDNPRSACEPLFISKNF